MPYRRRKSNRGYTARGKQLKTKNRSKDLDEIEADINEKSDELLSSEVNVELPGDGQFYCIHCVRYFVDQNSLSHHFKSKVHKRQLKSLELSPYSIKESEQAAGLGGSYSPPMKRKVETLLPKALLDDSSKNLEPELKKKKVE